ncbi:hypothetical protein OWV82_019426 [Melia azedarach]|uniref:Uncharacterized protein n=1 Tax=Melia azedarach TaxID=155640 RepID=A0ACC1XG46_MELAZ|nr:hypothetical protein OWV82_019426 [Melia azedarach]
MDEAEKQVEISRSKSNIFSVNSTVKIKSIALSIILKLVVFVSLETEKSTNFSDEILPLRPCTQLRNLLNFIQFLIPPCFSVLPSLQQRLGFVASSEAEESKTIAPISGIGVFVVIEILSLLFILPQW